MIKIDMWYGDKHTEADKIDIYFYNNEGKYRGYIYKNGKIIGDYFCTDSVELENNFKQLTFNWDKKEVNQMRAFEMIIEDRDDVYKLVRPAKSEKQLKEIYGGNGEFVRIKDVTQDTIICLKNLRETLEKAGYGKNETDIIVSMIQKYEGSY